MLLVGDRMLWQKVMDVQKGQAQLALLVERAERMGAHFEKICAIGPVGKDEQEKIDTLTQLRPGLDAFPKLLKELEASAPLNGKVHQDALEKLKEGRDNAVKWLAGLHMLGNFHKAMMDLIECANKAYLIPEDASDQFFLEYKCRFPHVPERATADRFLLRCSLAIA